MDQYRRWRLPTRPTLRTTEGGYDAFVTGGGWPPMSQGSEAVEKCATVNVGMAGFVAGGGTEGFFFSFWALIGDDHMVRRKPSAHVTKVLWSGVAEGNRDGIKAGGDHRRRLSRSAWRDGRRTYRTRRGEILPAFARRSARNLPLVVSLDLHATEHTPEMVEHADALIAYRTYPHHRHGETGRAAATHLAIADCAEEDSPCEKEFRQLAFLIRSAGNAPTTSPTTGSTKSLRRWRATR